MKRVLLSVSIVAVVSSAAFLACNSDPGIFLPDEQDLVDSGPDATSLADVVTDDSASGNDATPSDAAPGDGSLADGDAAQATDAHDGGDASDASDAGCTGVTLTVKDVLNWCTVSIDGGAAFMAGNQTVCATGGGTVNLVASPNNGFILGNGPWHNTSGDDGGGELGTTDGGSAVTTVVVGDGGSCVWVCCPFPDDSGCPTTNQCP